VSPDPLNGWVFCADQEDDLRTILHPGVQHLWESARSVGKEPGQPVLILYEGPDPPLWLGSGKIIGPEERWKVLGVHVECREVLRHPLPSIPSHREGTMRPEVADLLKAGAPRWENRSLATRIGLTGFRLHTPFMEEAADLRLSAGDSELLFVLQPTLRKLWHE
jgi:hypothetical protein